MKFINDWKLLLFASLTLGLAPFFPEPHIWGKLRWIAGGGQGMKLMDWFDFLMHGLPWFLLIRYFILQTVQRIKSHGKENVI
jgi:hypothetical protein